LMNLHVGWLPFNANSFKTIDIYSFDCV
jgi:hypothetical protein